MQCSAVVISSVFESNRIADMSLPEFLTTQTDRDVLIHFFKNNYLIFRGPIAYELIYILHGSNHWTDYSVHIRWALERFLFYYIENI